MLDLLRYGVTLAVQGGNGYGCQWDMMLDSAPSLAISAARLHQVRPNQHWLNDKWAFLKRPLEHILANIGSDGLYFSKRRSGNSGTCVWSTNAWDCISFGHQDAYSNALAYRALRGGVALARDAGDMDLSRSCQEIADRLQEVYAPILTNPETGLIAGWRSADGEYHDYAFTHINGMAICYGLVNNNQAKHIMQTIEEMRLGLGLDDFRYGLPVNLKPIRRNDSTAYSHNYQERKDGLDGFGLYINGCLTINLGYFYLRALSLTGYQDVADKACSQLLDSFVKGTFEGQGQSNGLEFFSQEGVRSGGEGTVAHGYHTVLAIAQHLKVVDTLSPEWWLG